ncbi:MAG: hypothetical protein AB1422_18715, partial [bacterium]
PQSISTYFYKFQSISIILSPYHSYLLIPFLTLLIYSLNGYNFHCTGSFFFTLILISLINRTSRICSISI